MNDSHNSGRARGENLASTPRTGDGFLVKFIVHRDFGCSRRAMVEIIPWGDVTPADHAVVHIHGACGWVYEDSLTEPHAEPLGAEPGGASPDQRPMGSCSEGVAPSDAGEAATTASRPSEGQATS